MTNYECRRFTRYEIDTPVDVSWGDGESQTAKTIDISAVGLHLDGDFDLAQGKTVKLVIAAADPGTPDIVGEATVVSCNAEGLRLDFSDMTQEDFENLCKHLQAINVTEPEKVDYEIAANLHLLHFLDT